MAQYPQETKITFVKLKQGEKDFFMTDGISIVPRAAIEISDMCPAHLKLEIHRAVAEGYLKSVAWVKEKDYMWEQLGG